MSGAHKRGEPQKVRGASPDSDSDRSRSERTAGKQQRSREERRARVLNLKHSRTSFSDDSGTWYSLDNAASIMPGLTDSVTTSLFRIDATLDHEVDRELLERALHASCARFPYFAVELRRGIFWYYFVPHSGSVSVQDDSESPCQEYLVRKEGVPLFRVRCSGKVIAGEFSHALTDGTGGIRFLKTLLIEYFRLRGVEPGAPLGVGEFADIPFLDGKPDPEEFEDAYHRHFKGDLPHPGPGTPAFHIPKARLPRHQYRIIRGTMPLDAIKEASRKAGVTITEFLSAVYIDALQSLWLDTPRLLRGSPHLVLEVPVNMRKYYPTKSNRNFSLFVLIGQDMRLGPRDFDEILSRTYHQLRMENDIRNIARQITRNVGGTRKLAVRLVPLFVKNFFARILFSKLGEDLLSSFLSNLGPVVMPPGPAAHIETFGFIPAVSPVTLTNASLVTWKNQLILSFGSIARSRKLEMFYFRRLRRLGIPVDIRCNIPGGG